MMKKAREMEECIHSWENCHRVCLEPIPHLLQLGGGHSESHHATLLLDCVQICQTSADFMMRSSPLHPYVCAVCAEVCELCAQDCERMMDGDIQMKACADICHRCAESCRNMAHVKSNQ